MNKTIKPNEKVWAWRFNHAELANGELKKSHYVGAPIYGITACEREEDYNKKALSNNDEQIKYFVPFKEGTEEPDWLRAQHIGLGLKFAYTKEDATKQCKEALKKEIGVLQSELDVLRADLWKAFE
jgi:hypothetical protein